MQKKMKAIYGQKLKILVSGDTMFMAWKTQYHKDCQFFPK